MDKSNIRAGRLTSAQYAETFCDIHPPLDQKMAAFESSRCYFCYDAPCMEACPTQINIPEFIRRISTENTLGAGTEILEANILGGTCSRVCPVEILCEQACVRNTSEDKPVTIGLLQRYATDYVFKAVESGKMKQPFTRARATGKKVAVVGGGPAGLSVAHRLAMLGHDVEIFEALPKTGGLNEYGIAVYKMLDDFAQREVKFLLSIGGITVHNGKRLGKELKLVDLRSKYASVFLSIGLGGVNALKLEGEDWPGVMNAVDYIAELRQCKNYSKMQVARDVVVIGGGNTAIDIAIQSKALGAENVTLVYRRGSSDMSATGYEQELAQTRGVKIVLWSRPVGLEGSSAGVRGVKFEKTRKNAKGELEGTNEFFVVPADHVFKAVGQLLLPEVQELEVVKGKFKVDARGETSVKGVYAGGDCIAHKEDLTVAAVQDGKISAYAIHEALTGEKLSGKGMKDYKAIAALDAARVLNHPAHIHGGLGKQKIGTTVGGAR
ncbi:MAG: NAD(P)-dependent oxidoreductase [Bdellovibrionales bacterium]|nr:NAD(P)-dependent oxidoreductase [Bdellovibrionales bacterium]